MSKEGVSRETADTVSPVASNPVPQESLRLDVERDDLAAPFGGLRVRFVGQAWGESDRIVLLLHGYGAEGDDLVPLAARLNEHISATYVLAEAPYALARGGRAWFRRDRQNFGQGLSYARSLLEYCARELPSTKLVIGGFSQGAMLTANLLGDLPASVVGSLIFSPADHLLNAPGAESRRIPLFLSHGTKDAVLPFSGGVSLKDRLKSLGFEVNFVEFEGRHQISARVVEEAALFLARVM